jgi:hypothetical protein
MKRFAAGAAVVCLGLGVLGCSTDTGSTDGSSSSSSSGGSGSKSKTSKASKSCGFKATDDCTPHVGPNAKVRVDALIWRVASVRTAKTIGDQQYGLGAKASGRFVIVKLKVHSDKNESADLSSDVVKLEIDGNTYDADNDGSVAAMGAGEEPFFLNTIGPDADRSGAVVFDIPPKKLSKKIEARFNELGLGSTHGYIALPSLS